MKLIELVGWPDGEVSRREMSAGVGVWPAIGRQRRINRSDPCRVCRSRRRLTELFQHLAEVRLSHAPVSILVDHIESLFELLDLLS